MGSRGASETQQLRQKLEEQLDRLMSQLSDLEECREDLDPQEYEEVRRDTLEQLTEFKSSLTRLGSGDMTLIDSINAMQLAIQAAVSEAFRTPEVIQMFAKKQPDQLKQKLLQVERDFKVAKLTSEVYTQQKLEILSALQKLGESLTLEQQSFLDSHASSLLKNFDQVSDEQGTSQKVMEMARKSIQ